MDTAVLFETFARPQYARQVFDQIKKAKPKKLYFYFRSVLRIRDREGLEENVLFHKLCIHLPSCCDPDPGAMAH